MKFYDGLYFILIFPLRQEYMHTVTFHMRDLYIYNFS